MMLLSRCKTASYTFSGCIKKSLHSWGRKNSIRQLSMTSIIYSDIYSEHQKRVPRLPIPILEETTQRYLEYISPLVSDIEFFKTQQAIKDFLLKDDGPNLQKELLLLDKESPTSYIEGFWDSAYLEARCPSPININPFFSYTPETSYAGRAQSQASRAASLVRSAANFHKMYQEGNLLPDMERDAPLCMRQYEKFLGSARIPYIGRDVITVHQESSHIIVIANNDYYILNIFHPNSLIPVSETTLRSQLQNILDMSYTDNTSTIIPPVGILTAQNRDVWASARSQLLELNKETIDKIDSALFVLSLDDTSVDSGTSDKAARSFLLAKENRWYDKLQIMVSLDGIAGVNMEHSPFDGHTALRFALEQQSYLHSNGIDWDDKLLSSIIPPKKLEWNFTNDDLQNIDEAKEQFGQFADNTELSSLSWKQYGKSFTTKVAKISPDAYVQMALQLAYHKTEPERYPVSTYESGMTKRFLAGRTEVVRSTSNESVAFTNAFMNKSNNTEKSRIKLFRVAANKHGERMKEAKEGKGVDRHLYALCSLAKHKKQKLPNYEIPLLFRDESYNTLSASVLSTSNCGCDALELFGFGPVVSDGIGVGYMIFDDHIQFCISSFRSNKAIEFKKNLEDSLIELKQTIDQTI